MKIIHNRSTTANTKRGICNIHILTVGSDRLCVGRESNNTNGVDRGRAQSQHFRVLYHILFYNTHRIGGQPIIDFLHIVAV